MAYRKKRYMRRRFKKRTYKRRRMISKIPRSRFKKYDGSVGVKLYATVAFVVRNTYGDVQIPWFGTNASANANTNYPPDIFSNVEFTDYASRYTYLRFVGIKMKYVPSTMISYLPAAAGALASLEQIWVGSSLYNPLDASTSLTEIQRKCDYQALNPAKGFKKYINLQKVGKQTDKTWLLTSSPAAGLINESQNTLFRINTYGLPDNTAVGAIELTYWFKFRGYDY